MSGEKSELPKDDAQTAPGAPPAYSDIRVYSYDQGPPNQPLTRQPNLCYVPYPGQQVVYGEPQMAPGTSVVVRRTEQNIEHNYGQPIPASQAPPDYFRQAIFVTLCCFWPTGIFAIMKASDARSAVARGDFASAQSSAKSAKFMVNISVGVGILIIVMMCVIFGVFMPSTSEA